MLGATGAIKLLDYLFHGVSLIVVTYNIESYFSNRHLSIFITDVQDSCLFFNFSFLKKNGPSNKYTTGGAIF